MPVPAYWCSCMFTCHCPSLGCELLHSRDVPESSLVPSAHGETWHNVGAAQQIFVVEFPFESNRNPTPILVWGRKPMETESPGGAAPWQGSPQMQSTHRHLLHFGIVFLLMLSIAGFIPAHSHFLSWKITRKLHAAPGTVANVIQAELSTWH